MPTRRVRSTTVPILPRARLSARALHASLRRPLGEALRAQLGVGRCGRAHIRPIRSADAPSWRAAMLANQERMAPWWGIEVEFERATDDVAFLQHRREWGRKLHRGSGACLGIFGEQGLVGEVQLWHLSPGGLTGEIGLWISPTADVPITDAAGCVGYVVDRLVHEVGLQRLDGPVAVGNSLPRPLLRLAGFEIEARILKWREVHGELADYDLFTLTPERWTHARPAVRAALGDWVAVS